MLIVRTGPSSASSSSSTFLNDVSAETTGLIETKIHLEPPWGRGTKVCSYDLAQMATL